MACVACWKNEMAEGISCTMANASTKSTVPAASARFIESGSASRISNRARRPAWAARHFSRSSILGWMSTATTRPEVPLLVEGLGRDVRADIKDLRHAEERAFRVLHRVDDVIAERRHPRLAAEVAVRVAQVPRFERLRVLPTQLLNATARIAHRGPDDQGFFTDPDLALGFRRLAVIDPSPAGRQPMHSADGRYVMVFDGEIYNYVELAQRLAGRGVQLRSRSSSEVLLEMYAWLGKDVVRQLRGMYAFAIWDRRDRELFCARDPFGIKPFFYALTTGGHRPRSGPQLRFASERKALADSGEVTAIDPDALRRYLSFQYVPAPATLVPPARSLPPRPPPVHWPRRRGGRHRPGCAAPLPVVPVRTGAGHAGAAGPVAAARARADRAARRPGRRLQVLAS